MNSAPRAPWRLRILAGVGVVVVAALFVVAGRSADTDGPGGARHPAIEDLFPAPDSQAVRQVAVGLQLEIGWTADLEIDRTPIPPDQLEGFNPDLGRVDDPLGRIIYDPGQGKEIEIFRQGEICVTAFITKIDEPAERGVTSWCFTAT